MKKLHFIYLLMLTSLFAACASLPDVYVIDRHTVMEAEASGEWPELENRFFADGLHRGPVAFKKEKSRKRTNSAFTVLDTEYTAKQLNDDRQSTFLLDDENKPSVEMVNAQ